MIFRIEVPTESDGIKMYRHRVADNRDKSNNMTRIVNMSFGYKKCGSRNKNLQKRNCYTGMTKGIVKNDKPHRAVTKGETIQKPGVRTKYCNIGCRSIADRIFITRSSIIFRPQE